MASLAVLVLASLICALPVTQSRPRKEDHGRIYDELKPVPFVDQQDITGSAEMKPISDSLDSFEQYYNKYNKDHDRVIGSSEKQEKYSDTDTKQDVNQDANIVPVVEGGLEDMTTRTKILGEEKPATSKKRHHHHRKERGSKKTGKAKVEEPDLKNTESDFEGIGFDIEKFYREHPNFKENVATIVDNTADSEKEDDSKDADMDDVEGTDDDEDDDDDDDDDDDEDDDDENADDDDDDNDDDDDDVDDDKKEIDDKEDNHTDDEMQADESVDEESDDDDEVDGKDEASHDLSSEMFDDYYDYYDELDDSSYSSSEQEAERLGNQLFNGDEWYNKMFGDQPAATEEEKNVSGDTPAATKVERTESEEVKYTEAAAIKSESEAKVATAAMTTESEAKVDAAPIKPETEAKIPEAETKKDGNIPKTDIEPSTSPNPPTPKKDVRSTVTQPVYPQQKSMLETWNYIESTPIEACQEDSNCSAGRMCMFGLCLCGQPNFCEGHRKPTCGSDGRLYPSHCELHRTACVLKTHIRIDSSDSCMPKTTTGKGVDAIAPIVNGIIQTTGTAMLADQPAAVDTIIPVKAEDTLLSADSGDAEDKPVDNNLADSDNDKTKLDTVKTETAVKDTADTAIPLEIGNTLVGDRTDLSTEEEDDDLDISLDSDEVVSDSVKPEVNDLPEAATKVDSVGSYETETASEDVTAEMAGGQVTEESVTVDMDKGSTEVDGQSLIPLFCTPDVYQQFKADVLQYHCIFFNEPNCDRQTQEGKHKLAELMFNYFDKNYNGVIEDEELWEMQLRESMDKLSSLCTLLDIVTFDDLGERDERLTADEFIQAFDIPDLLEHRTEVVPLLATIGNGLETKCDVTTSEDVVWKRNGVDLSLLDFPGISVLGDGSLYLETIGFHHVGNLTCNDRKKPSVKQVHMLTVQKPPHVIVSPQAYESDTEADIVLHCHVEGYPRPSLEWQFEGKAVTLGAKYYIHPHDNTLTIMKVDHVNDSGIYKCVGRNEAGSAEAVVTVKVHGPNDTAHSTIALPEETFIVFHDDGYTMHDPELCSTQRHVKPDFGNFYFIPDELDAPPSLCESGQPCMWGETVNVQNKFVYAAQPREGRVVVLDIQDTFNPNQVIFTDKTPVSLYYVEHLDEVWVLCWNGDADTGSKTVVVIRNASQKTQHHSVHTQPIGNRFDVVNDIFLPPSTELHHPYKFGYTVHNGQQGMFKVDLTQKKYMKAVDLTKYNCVPVDMAFVPLGGHVLIQCAPKPSLGLAPVVLQLDYVTDTVIGNLSESGTPYITPDVSKAIVINEATGKIAVFKINENGEIIKEFDVTVGPVLKGVAFHTASYSQGYDVYLTSSEKPIVMSVSLENGKVDEIREVGEPDSAMYLAFFKKMRPLVSGDVFSDFLVTTAPSSMVIVNGRTRKVQCDFRDIQNPVALSYAHFDRN